MLKIGDFARLSQVSVVTLRHYDEIGLLKPSKVDRDSGYRYYSVSQLPRLNRILALKDLGFSLEHIEQVLNGITLEQLQGMLMLRHAELEQHLEDEQARLKRVVTRLKQIELEDAMPNYDVILKTIPATIVATRHITIPTNDQVPQYLDAALCEAYNYVIEQCIKPIAPCFAIWHQSAEILENEVVDAAVPINQLLPSTDRIQVYELPQTQVAAAVHHGDFEDFTQLHTVLLKWIEDNQYRIVGSYREIYIQHDRNNMNETTTEVQYPVEKLT